MPSRLFILSGATGFIGGELLNQLHAQGEAVCCVSRETTPVGPNGVKSTTYDLLSTYIPHAFSNYSVIHLGGEASGEAWEANPAALRVDHERRLDQLLSFVASRVSEAQTTFVAASTATVVGSTQGVLRDDKQANPETEYDNWKFRQEVLIQSAASSANFNSVSLRLPNIYGKLQFNASRGRGFVSRAVLAACKGENLYYYHGVKFERDYLHVGDASRALVAACRLTAENPTFLVGSGVGTTMHGLMRYIANAVQEIAGFDVQLVEIDPPSPLSNLDRRNVVIDSGRFSAASGWQPLIPIKTGIAGMVCAALNSDQI